jgi:hypothetical protein
MGVVSPFEFNWLVYDRQRLSHVRYIELVLSTMQEQVTMWGVDSVTKKSWVFGWINEFLSKLLKLYQPRGV